MAGNRANLAKNLKVPNENVRILTANVGGSFGMKNINYPEYMCILYAAKTLGRPVKWLDERSTSFLSDSHGRAQKIHAELALDAEGHFLAAKLSGYGNLGAYITGVAPSPLSLNTSKNFSSVYRTPLMAVDIKTVLTNTTLMGAYRGAGRPGQLLHGAANRPRRGRDGHQPADPAEAQLHQAEPDAVRRVLRRHL